MMSHMKAIKNSEYLNPLTGENLEKVAGKPYKVSGLMIVALEGCPAGSYDQIKKIERAHTKVKDQQDEEWISLEDQDFDFVRDTVRAHKPYLALPLIFANLLGDTFDKAEAK